MGGTAVIRRRFLGAVGAALAAPAIVPARVLGAGAPSERINVGMIGMGRQALYANLRPFLGSPDARVVAVCDVDAARLKTALEAVEKHYAGEPPHFGVDQLRNPRPGAAERQRVGDGKVCTAHRDFREVLGRADVDAVMISTPDHWHVPQAVAAVRAGKHVSCEKPTTLSIAEGRLLCDEVARHRRIFRTDSEFRSIAVFRRACELVLNGRIGKLHTIRTGVPGGDPACPHQPTTPVPEGLDYAMWLGPAPDAPYTERRVHPGAGYGRPGWMCIRDYCDGKISNWGTHLNDIAQWGHGTDRTGPVEIEGRGDYPPDGLWNVLLRFEVRYKFADGVEMVYKSDAAYVRFEGTDGWVRADYGGKGLEAEPKSLLTEAIGPSEIHLPTRSDKEDFLWAIKHHRETMEPAEVGHRTNSLCQLGLISIDLGRKLRWDPARECFPDDAEANRLLSRPLRQPWGL
ncbi:MAG: Gfo/Idh/MocA family oxidoreductase [Planctomycetes bacterium]|nr:Gfo/Idh/MocA family oxidoreductase [Planctomycetota bacterium]